MMRLGAVALAFAAACTSGRGVEIEILGEEGAPKFDRVELYIAYDQCYDCAPGVAWPNALARPEGDIYMFRDERRIVAAVDKDTQSATLHLTVDSGDYSDPERIAVVAYAGDKAVAVKILDGVHIPTSSVAVWKVYLHPAMTAMDVIDPRTPADSDHYRVLTWDRRPTIDNDDPAACVVYQKWEDPVWTTQYFVPKSDPDCDGEAIECSPYWWEFNKEGSHNYCVTTANSDSGVCHTGQSACADGFAADTACGLDPTWAGLRCLPAEMCNTCDASIPVEDCLASTYASLSSAGTPTVPVAECSFQPGDTTGGPCQGAKVTVTVPPTSNGTSMSNCRADQIRLHTLASPILGGNAEVVIGPLANTKFKALAVTGNPCTIDIYWIDGLGSVFANGVTLLLEIGYENGNIIYYPVRIYAEGTAMCSTSTTARPCTNIGASQDTMFRCTAN